MGRDAHGFRYGKVISPQRDPLNGLSYGDLYLSINGSGQFCDLFHSVFGPFGSFDICGSFGIFGPFGIFGAFGICRTFFTRKGSRKNTSV
jgi:hypothetical protein